MHWYFTDAIFTALNYAYAAWDPYLIREKQLAREITWMCHQHVKRHAVAPAQRKEASTQTKLSAQDQKPQSFHRLRQYHPVQEARRE